MAPTPHLWSKMMEKVAQTLLLPIRSIYQQHGLKIALPAALMWFSGLTTLLYGINETNGIIINLGLALWVSTHILALLTNDASQHHTALKQTPTALEQNNDYDEDPLAAVRAALHNEKSSLNKNDHLHSELEQNQNKPLPACTVAF